VVARGVCLRENIQGGISCRQHKRAASGLTSHQCTEAAVATVTTAAAAAAAGLSVSLQENHSLQQS